jgi:hypothetical protein
LLIAEIRRPVKRQKLLASRRAANVDSLAVGRASFGVRILHQRRHAHGTIA